ncbi:MAG: PAS domain-containing protein [Planctomycetaceae bacterium]|nr:PAS domain-containing protein [Planctomycetaceae bacterium]
MSFSPPFHGTSTLADDKAIRLQLAEFAAIYNYAPIAHAIFDCDLPYVRTTDRLAKFIGFPALEHFSKTLFEVVPEIAPQAEPRLQEVLQSRESIIHRKLHGIARVENPSRDWLASYLPQRSDGQLIGMTFFVREATGRIQAEQQLPEREKSLEDVARLRTATIEMLHDIASHVHQEINLPEPVEFTLKWVAEFNDWSFGQAFQISSNGSCQPVSLGACFEETVLADSANRPHRNHFVATVDDQATPSLRLSRSGQTRSQVICFRSLSKRFPVCRSVQLPPFLSS